MWCWAWGVQNMKGAQACDYYYIQWNLRRRATVGSERLALVERLAFLGIVCYSVFSERKGVWFFIWPFSEATFYGSPTFRSRVVGRWPEFGGCHILLLFGGSKCVKSMLSSIRTLRFGRCREGPLTQVPPYVYHTSIRGYYIGTHTTTW